MTEATKQDIEQRKIDLSRWLNEDTLINQRLTWLLMSQALLFAAYGTIATKAMDACLERATYLISILTVVSYVGPLFALVVLVGIGAAIGAQLELRKAREPRPKEIGVSTKTTLVGWATCLSFPTIFLAAWIFVPTPQIRQLLPSCAVVTANAQSPLGTAPTSLPPPQPAKQKSP